MKALGEGFLPPHDLDAEAAVLSAVMIGPEVLDGLSFLRPEHFYSESHRRIFEACRGLAAVGRPVDVVQVSTWLRNHQRIEQVGGLEYMTELLNAAPALAHARAYAETVHGKWRLRELIGTCQRLAAQGYCHAGPVDSLLENAEQSMFELARANLKRPRLRPLREPITREVRRLADHAARVARGEAEAGALLGVTTGFVPLDRVLGGLHIGDLTVVAARPGMGKTAFVVRVCEAVARASEVVAEGHGPPLRIDCVATLFSLEMPDEQIAMRAVCAEAEVDIRKPRSGSLSEAEWRRIHNATIALSADDRFLLDDTPSLSLLAIRGMVREADSEARRRGRRVRLVAVDYLQLMRAGEGGREVSREQEVAAISKGLKAMAKEFQISVIALAQLNRGVESRADKRPMLSDLRESGAIEQDADNILFVYRDEYYNPESADRGIAEIIIGKQRNGPTGCVRLAFDAPYTRFRDLPEGFDDAR